MNEDRLQTIKDIKIANSTTNYDNYAKRNGYNSKAEFNKSFFSDLDNVKI